MKDQFFGRAEALGRGLRAGEILLCNLSAERSDFVRFNHGKVRQAGTVSQAYLTLRLVRDRRQATATVMLDGDDHEAALASLRDSLDGLPEDPWLLYNEAPRSSESVRRGAVPASREVVDSVVEKSGKLDFVGIYAGGAQMRGFANSLGQKNWHEVDSFNLDFSLHGEADRAVKSGYAGFEWDGDAFAGRIRKAEGDFELLGKAKKTIGPGEYRAYLAPRAMAEITWLLQWGAFSARSLQTKQSPLLRMQQGERLSPKVSFQENTAAGIAPGFQGHGFIKPGRVVLVEQGELRDALVSPRSAKEFGLEPNASANETPASLDMREGTLEEKDVLQALGTGLYLSNLWYLNFSDRPAARITGMTRFATFWVEDGRIAGPVGPMRFDDSLYRMLGENLVDVTRNRDLLPDASTYGERSTSSERLPGILLKSLRFTL